MSNPRIYLECQECGYVFELPTVSRKMYNLSRLFNNDFTCRKCQCKFLTRIDKTQFQEKRAKYFTELYNTTVCSLSRGGDR